MASIKTVDEYIENNASRALELKKLRKIALSLPFEECVKWGMPTYTVNKKNVVGLGSFKNWSCVWFHNGSFLKDDHNVLENAQEGKTKGMRQWRFRNIEEIDENLLRSYLQEAIENQLAGKEIKAQRKSSKRVQVPMILEDYLNLNLDHLKTFQGYTISQQNEFCNYILEAKREKTKLSRLEKIKDLIEEKQTLSSLWK